MMHLRTDKKSEMLKSVKSKFLTGDKAQGIQLIIDSNALNTFIYEIALVEEFFSLRDLLKKDPSLYEAYGEHLNTEHIKDFLP